MLECHCGIAPHAGLRKHMRTTGLMKLKSMVRGRPRSLSVGANLLGAQFCLPFSTAIPVCSCAPTEQDHTSVCLTVLSDKHSQHGPVMWTKHPNVAGYCIILNEQLLCCCTVLCLLIAKATKDACAPWFCPPCACRRLQPPPSCCSPQRHTSFSLALQHY